MRAGGRLWAAVAMVAFGSAGCEDPPGELDPEFVAELARTEGTARGYDRTGAIGGMLSTEDCPCPTDPAFATLSLCASVLSINEQGMIFFPGIQATQTDGRMVLNLPESNFVMSGPLDDDGALHLGAVTNLSSVIAEGYIVTRADGVLSLTSNGDYSLDIGIRHRVLGRMEFSTDPDLPQSIDCVETLRATGTLPGP